MKGTERRFTETLGSERRYWKQLASILEHPKLGGPAEFTSQEINAWSESMALLRMVTEDGIYFCSGKKEELAKKVKSRFISDCKPEELMSFLEKLITVMSEGL